MAQQLQRCSSARPYWLCWAGLGNLAGRPAAAGEWIDASFSYIARLLEPSSKTCSARSAQTALNFRHHRRRPTIAALYGQAWRYAAATRRHTLLATTRYGQAKAGARWRRGVCARCNSFQHWEERTAQKLAAASQLMRCSALCVRGTEKKKKKKIKLELERSKNQGWILFSSCKCFSSRIRTLSARYLALIRFLCIV